MLSTTPSLHLHPLWRESINEFQSAYADVAKTINKVKPMAVRRRNDRVTPKLQCLFEEVPACIEFVQFSFLLPIPRFERWTRDWNCLVGHKNFEFVVNAFEALLGDPQ